MEVRYKFPKMIIDEEKYKNHKFETQDRQLESLPKEIRFCKKCIISNQRPRTQFDENGVCNACNYAEMKFNGGIDWEKREEELVELLDKHRSKDGKWDVIVPGSAGKDSAIVVHQLKAKYGMHPLHITWAPFIYSDIGWQNYFNLVQTGFDCLVAWPNG
ncbi:MAG: N-acetyl sugar amidotransferase, partial [Candidatus Omnitrophota bacterium]